MNYKAIIPIIIIALPACGGSDSDSDSNQPVDQINNHKFVDLGLTSTLKWATTNLGANSESDPGTYYMWAATTDCSSTNCADSTCASYGQTISDYSQNSQYDAATAAWGNDWRTPTATELQELISECDWVLENGGYRVKSKVNTNSIFLPFAGYKPDSAVVDQNAAALYLSSTPASNNEQAQALYADSTTTPNIGNFYRFFGATIRPVINYTPPTTEETDTTAVVDTTSTDDPEINEFVRPTNDPDEYNQTGAADHNGYVYIPLGLASGTQWAVRNVGATSQYDYGNLFMWADTTVADNNTCDYTTCPSYNVSVEDFYANPNNDPATKQWGTGWATPTNEQMQELLNTCTWLWTKQIVGDLTIYGYKVTGPNNNSIFLPATGERYQDATTKKGTAGYYWTSTPSPRDNTLAYRMRFDEDEQKGGTYFRCYGFAIRPVLDPNAKN